MNTWIKSQQNLRAIQTSTIVARHAVVDGVRVEEEEEDTEQEVTRERATLLNRLFRKS